MEEMKNKHVSFENSAFLEMSLVIPEPRTNKKNYEKKTFDRAAYESSENLLRLITYQDQAFFLCTVNNNSCQKLQFLFVTFFTVARGEQCFFFCQIN